MSLFPTTSRLDAGPSSASEIAKERLMGGLGTTDASRSVACISLADFDARRDEIAEELWHAATHIGFFQLTDHGIPQALVDQAFARSASLFALPDRVKAQYPLKKALNAGWEKRSQVRPSIGVPDQKESYQITRPHMDGLWPTEAELPGFQAAMLDFESRCWTVAMRVLSCFAFKLGLDSGFFTRAHDPSRASYQSTLRLLHYFALTPEQRRQAGPWRGGAHTDFDCLTLLFQRAGQGGLQVCPGAEMQGEAWTAVPPLENRITCNIGDMLMRWSDDRLKSNFHRVAMPGAEDDQGGRYSIAFFAQGNRDAVIEGPQRKYPAITAGDYLNQRVAANYSAYRA